DQWAGVGWRAYIGATNYLQAEIIGFINLYHANTDFYTDVDAARLEVFAQQAAISIQNARLHRASHELGMVQERQRLARELHDSVTQTLFTSTVMADSALRQWEANPTKAHTLLTQVLHATTSALAEMRVLLLELRPQALIQVSLEQLIHQLVVALEGRRQINFSVQLDPIPLLPPDTKIGIYRIFQEILNNIVKHSNASSAEIAVRVSVDALRLTVRDDGAGFELTQTAPNSLGLNIMRERASLIGGELDIDSAPGQGTQVSLTLPYQPQTQRK
ncbi:MAG: sensor histidine kinase, partial [Armatimonadetes bacterium]|nr:sensor histidine kinase [Anaerolineae bacterium]